MPTFRDREEALNQICAPTDQTVLLNIYGEAGIGKSRLLHEAAQRLREEPPPALVLHVDLKPLTETSTNRPEAAIRALIAQSKGQLSGVWQNVEQVAGQVVAQLIELALHTPVVLMLDTTETLQEDMEFWRWMEANLVGPLAVEGQVRQVFAGRVPVPWRRIEVRRALKLLRLEPLSTQDAARALVKEVLQQQNPDLEGKEPLEQAVGLVMEFSFGHPLLSEKLAQYVAPRWSAPSPDKFRRELCEQVVEPFIEQFLFDGIDHLDRVDRKLVEERPDYFFIQGITRLRIRHTVVWREASGDRLHGVIADIVRHCLKVLDPDRYRSACRSAAETFEALVGEFPEGSPEAEQYRQEAETYSQRAEQETAQ
jgi:hypothetical protein